MVVDNSTSLLLGVPTKSTAAPSSTTSSWGPQRDPLPIVVPITVLYALIFLLGVVGNLSTCVVIARNKHMHTATNYYLFSLAVSDLLLLVSGLPQEMYSIWSRYPYVFGEPFCVLQGFAAETSANATVLTITAFTVERYVAICHPFLSHTMSKLSRAVKFIVAIWVLALCLAVPQAMQFGLVYETGPDGEVVNPGHMVCAIKRDVIPHSFEISTFVFFVAPMTLITVLYVLIGVQLRRSSALARRDGGGSARLGTQPVQPKRAVLVLVKDQPREEFEEDDCRKNFARNAQAKATKHVVNMLVAVVVAFFICWAPFHAQRLLAVYASDVTRPSATVVALFTGLTYVSGILYYLSTTVNPFLYHIMSHKFREAFKDTLARYLGRRRGRGGRWHCYSVLSGRHSNNSNNNNSSTCNSNASQRSASSLRYLEADIARIHGARRPVVVSFRRPAASAASTLTRETVVSDPEVQVSLEMAPAASRTARNKSKPKRSDACRATGSRYPKIPGLADVFKARNPSTGSDFGPRYPQRHSSSFDESIISSYNFPRPEMIDERDVAIDYDFPNFPEKILEDKATSDTLPSPSAEKHVDQTMVFVVPAVKVQNPSVALSSPPKQFSSATTQTEFRKAEDQSGIPSTPDTRKHLQERVREAGLGASECSSVGCCRHNACNHPPHRGATLAGKACIPRSSTYDPCKISPASKSHTDFSSETDLTAASPAIADDGNGDINSNNAVDETQYEHPAATDYIKKDEETSLLSPPITGDEPTSNDLIVSNNVNNNGNLPEDKLRSEDE